jgi:RNA methyltransferase, TrmH family
MISKNQIKLITSLQQKKYRKEEMLFIAEGEKVVKDLLRSECDVVAVYGTELFFQNLGKDVRISKSTEVEFVTDDELRKMSALTTPQKVLAVVRIPEQQSEINYDSGLKIVLDNISDPGNLGTVIRIADWFGIKEIACSRETVDCYNPKVVQATMGSLFNVTLIYDDLENIFERNIALKNLPVFGMVLDGNNIYGKKYPADGFILMGNEAAGVDFGLQKFITNRITIPGFGSKADSLNVAIATGIICYEFRRPNE